MSSGLSMMPVGSNRGTYASIPDDVEAHSVADPKPISPRSDRRVAFQEDNEVIRERIPMWRLPNSSTPIRAMTMFVFLGTFFITLWMRTHSAGASTVQPQSLLANTSPYKWVKHPMPISSLWGVVQRPFPTGAFWTNLAVNDGLAPVALHPYGVKCTPAGVLVSYGPTRRVVTDVAITDPFDIDVSLAAAEAYVARSIKRYDGGSVTMGFKVGNNGEFDAHLVKGSPYVTVTYKNATPMVSSINMKVISANQKGYAGRYPCPGEQYILALGNGQRWLLWASGELNLQKSSGSSDILLANGLFTGTIRLALLPPPSDNGSGSPVPGKEDAAFDIYMQYMQRFPIGVDFSFDYSNEKETQLHVQYRTRGDGQLLMFMLPHHKELLQSNTDSGANDDIMRPDSDNISSSSESVEAQKALSPFFSTKGPLLAAVGSKWLLKYAIDHVSWDYALSADIKHVHLAALKAQLRADVAVPISTVSDPYGFGKEIGRMSRLALMASSLEEEDARQDALLELENKLGPWLSGTNPDALVYDATYGGLVPKNGLADKGADFGAGWYNDHHFHYGYFAHAAAVIARLHPKFHLKHKTAFDSIVRDICSVPGGIQDVNDDNGSDASGGSTDANMGNVRRHLIQESFAADRAAPPTDREKKTQFPPARHKDMFDGHSWASGLFPQGNGKGQESSSEAANAYYSCFLYGDATKDVALQQHSRLLLAMEVQSIKHYWQMLDTQVYDSYFASSLMVGNVGAFDVTTTTWFGNNIEYVHGIQMMPITPAMGLLLKPDFVKYEWPLLAKRLSAVEASHVNKATNIPKQEGSTDKTTKHTNNHPTCAANSECHELKINGDCCPTLAGVYLTCCDKDSSSSSEQKTFAQLTIEQLSQRRTLQSDPPVQDEWRSLLYLDRAVVQRELAVDNILSQDNFGTGNSKTNSLMWALSRDSPLSGYTGDPEEVVYTVPKPCADNSACAASGMLGNCCPAPGGWNEWGKYNSSMLGCCPKILHVLGGK